jgi:putative ABC transport system permease protein
MPSSMAVELAGVAVAGLLLGAVPAAGAVAAVYRRLDVHLLRPPTPLLDVPWAAVAATVVVTVVVARLTALYAQRAADRADPASVLREDTRPRPTSPRGDLPRGRPPDRCR